VNGTGIGRTRNAPVAPWPVADLEERIVSFMTGTRAIRGRRVLGLLAVSALVFSACGGSTATQAPAASGGAAGASAPAAGNGPKFFVVGGKSDDPFWSKVKKGVDDQAKLVEAYGGSVTWLAPQNYDNLGPDAAKLIQTALGQNPSGIIGPDWVPEAEDAAFKAVVAAGVPLIIYNAGNMDKASELGALNYVGNDEYTAGLGGGEYLGSNGIKNILCVNTLPGAANIEARCKGLSDGVAKSGGTSSQLPLPASNFGNPTAVGQAVKAALLKDPTIDAAVAVSAGDATALASGIDQASLTGKVKLGSFDFDQAGLDRIKAGTQAMAIDQQPYLQGSLSVALLNSYVLFGNNLPTRPVATGPGIIDSTNVDLTLKGVTAGAR
jgi:simple sugar transport system substrate-binding protein